MTVKELFEREGFTDDYKNVQHLNLLHADSFVKFSRDAVIPKNTVVFGNVNRLDLIKNKMKHNADFHDNVECVDIRDLSSWCKRMREFPIEIDDEEDDIESELDSVVDEDDEDNISDITEYDVVSEDNLSDYLIPDLEDIEANKRESMEENQELDLQMEAPVDNSQNMFKFEYLIQPVSISKITSGYSINDQNPKELANAFIKTLIAM